MLETIQFNYLCIKALKCLMLSNESIHIPRVSGCRVPAVNNLCPQAPADPTYLELLPALPPIPPKFRKPNSTSGSNLSTIKDVDSEYITGTLEEQIAHNGSTETQLKHAQEQMVQLPSSVI